MEIEVRNSEGFLTRDQKNWLKLLAQYLKAHDNQETNGSQLLEVTSAQDSASKAIKFVKSAKTHRESRGKKKTQESRIKHVWI